MELGLRLDDIVLISAGRLDANKNNKTTIRAIAKVPDVKLLLCGDGELKDSLNSLVESLGVSDRVFFLGNRTDIIELYQAADIFVMMSFREGLSRSIMEAMASGLPCIVSSIRGNVDLVKNDFGGYLVDPKDANPLSEKVRSLSEDIDSYKRFCENNKSRIKDFSFTVVTKHFLDIYNSLIAK